MPRGRSCDDRTAQLKRAAFLRCYRRYGNISQAARAAGVDRRKHYDWLKNVPGYEAALKDAAEESIERLEEIATKRAEKGSDVLTIFLLKGLKPNKYRERYGVVQETAAPFKVYGDVAAVESV